MGRRDHHFAIFGERRRVAIDLGAESGDKRARFDRHQMHLPVSRDQFLALTIHC